MLWDHCYHYDDYDIAAIIADFWHIMDESQRRRYIERSVKTYGTPDFLLLIPEYVESLNFESLLQYTRDWSGGGSIQVLEILAREHWKEMSEAQKTRWHGCANDYIGEIRDDLYTLVAIGKSES